MFGATAEEHIKYILEGEDRASGVFDRVAGNIQSAGHAILGGIGLATGAVVGLGGAMIHLAADAEPLIGVRKGFEDLTAEVTGGSDAMLKALRESSHGWVTDADLMMSYNQAASLVGDQFAQNLPTAMGYLSKVASSTGMDMNYMLDSLVRGVGRLSPLILDNLGIQASLSEATERAAEMFGKEASELTKAEQQAGMFNVIMEKLEENTAAMELPDKPFASLKVTLENLRHELGEKLAPAFGPLIELFGKLASVAGEWLGDALEKIAPIIERVGEALGWLFGFIEDVGLKEIFDPLDEGELVLEGFFTKLGMGRDQAHDLALGILDVVDTLKGFWESIIKVKDEVMKFVQPIMDWISENVELKDILIAIGGVIAAVVIPFLISIAAAVAPVIAAFAAIVLVVRVLRKAWEDDFGGIRSALTKAWEEKIKPALETLWKWLQEFIPQAIETLKEFWEETLLPVLEKVGEFISETIIPVLADIYEWLLTNIPIAIERAKEFWEEHLHPAIQKVADWIIEKLLPTLADIVEWLRENIPKAIAKAKEFWEETLKPALEKVWQFITEHVIPALADIFNWLKDNIPKAIATAKEFWEEHLKPALETVWQFIVEHVIPAIEDIFGWLQEKIPEAIATAKDFWENHLKPAMETIRDFIRDELIPKVIEIRDWLSDKLKTAIETVRDWWDKFKDALERVRDWVIKVITKITEIRDFLRDKLKNVIETVTGIIDSFKEAWDRVKGVLEWVAGLIETVKQGLANLSLPDWLIGHSPSPFESSLVGIHNALSAVNADLVEAKYRFDTLGRTAINPMIAATIPGGSYGTYTERLAPGRPGDTHFHLTIQTSSPGRLEDEFALMRTWAGV